MNNEFMRFGVLGMSILFSSGDDGSASYLGRTDPTACNKAHPEFPATRYRGVLCTTPSCVALHTLGGLVFVFVCSPYVTSVGATQLSRMHANICAQTSSGLTVGYAQLASVQHDKKNKNKKNVVERTVRVVHRCPDAKEVACSAETDGVITTGGTWVTEL